MCRCVCVCVCANPPSLTNRPIINLPCSPNQSNMEYPIGSTGCWNQSNVNCTDPTDKQCSYGCVNNSGVEIADMANFPNLRLYNVRMGASKTPRIQQGSSGWAVPGKMGGHFSALCWVRHFGSTSDSFDYSLFMVNQLIA